ncbi:winged helix-turn-helix domain-containing protein [Tenggerimyces flavus]|nr:helix-turn-helix domain-containing protein [Tenggerimyces flavus]
MSLAPPSTRSPLRASRISCTRSGSRTRSPLPLAGGRTLPRATSRKRYSTIFPTSSTWGRCDSTPAPASHAGSNNLSVHMRRIRLRLGDDPRNPRIILSVRGVGYRLVLPEASYIRWRNQRCHPKRHFAIGSKIRQPDYLPNVA